METDITQDVSEVVNLFELDEVNAYLANGGWKLLKVLAKREESGCEYPQYVLGWTLDYEAVHPR